jgi:hypothetical protein
MCKPNFFIVGAPKCGTTAMHEYLKQHPEVFMSRFKEPHFFGTDLYSPRFLRDERKYQDIFAEALYMNLVGESSVYYLYSSKAAHEIKAFCSKARIIIMLRDPVDTMYSLHSQLIVNGAEDIVDFEAALDAEEDRKKGRRIPQGADPVQRLFYREMTSYTKQVERYLNVFGRDHVHIIIFDDLRKKTEQVYYRTCEFLDIDPAFKPRFEIINPNRRVRNMRIHKLLNFPNPLSKRIVRSIFPDSLRISLKRLGRLNVMYGPRPAMAPELRKKLQAEFATEVEHLSELLGRDLTFWSHSRDG